jgi:hypothetical protein
MQRNESFSENNDENRTGNNERPEHLQRRWISSIPIVIFAVIFALLSIFVIPASAKTETTVSSIAIPVTTTRQPASKLYSNAYIRLGRKPFEVIQDFRADILPTCKAQ